MLIQLTFPAIFFHPINAFEENGYLVLDAPVAEKVVENYNFLDTVDRSEKQYSVQLSNTPPTVPTPPALSVLERRTSSSAPPPESLALPSWWRMRREDSLLWDSIHL